MKELFADSFYFIALRNKHDRHHSKALAAGRDLDYPLVTTEWVLVELADAFAGSAIRPEVVEFIREMESDPDIRIIRSNERLFSRGMDLYEARPDKEWSLTDCLSFVVMGDEGISEALTGDKHFEQAGFVALLK